MQQSTGRKKEPQVQMVYWDGARTYFIFAEGQAINISGQEANRLIFREGWAAEIGANPNKKFTLEE